MSYPRIALGRVHLLCLATILWCTSEPCLVWAQTGSLQDLGSVLAAHEDLSRYYNLIKKYPNVLLRLPNYSGVTVSAICLSDSFFFSSSLHLSELPNVLFPVTDRDQIIAPSNAAFENIPYTALNEVWDENNPEVVTPILEYHMIQGTLATNALETGPSVFASTLLTDPRWANVTGGQKIIINKQPGDEIVFASGDGTRTTMSEGDIPFTGGLIQVVDNLLIPPSHLNRTLNSFQAQSFLGALYAGQVYEEFDDASNVTIFVPRNQGFQKVNSSLATLDTKALSKVVKYHLVPNQYLPFSSLMNDTTLKSSSGGAIRLSRAGNNLYVNSAQIVQPDIIISNGVMHLIDNVLNPDASEAKPNPSLGTQSPVFAGATSASGKTLPFTTALPCTTQGCPTTTSTEAMATISRNNSLSSSTTATGAVASESSRGGAAEGPRCTGWMGPPWSASINIAVVAGLAAIGL